MTPKLPDMSGRRALVTAGTVIALAAVILGVSAVSRTGGRARTGSAYEPTADQLAAKAGIAIRSGDDTSALSLAMRALALDAANQEAKSVAEQVATARATRAGSTPDASGSQPSSPTSRTASDSAFTKQLANPVMLLPTAFPGYSLGQAVAVGGEVSLSATADSAGTAASRVVWAIHDAQSSAAAVSFIKQTSKSLYARDVTSASIDGVEAYVATDGTRYACAVYTRGRYVFEVLVSGTDGAPQAYRETAVAAARAFADAPAN